MIYWQQMPSNPAVSREILEAALRGLELQRQQLDEHTAEIRRMLRVHVHGAAPKPAATETAPSSNGSGRKKRTMSPEARKRIAIAQRKRWAAFRKASK